MELKLELKRPFVVPRLITNEDIVMLSEKVPLFPKELAIFLFDTLWRQQARNKHFAVHSNGEKEQSLETLDLLIEPLQVPDNADH